MDGLSSIVLARAQYGAEGLGGVAYPVPGEEPCRASAYGTAVPAWCSRCVCPEQEGKGGRGSKRMRSSRRKGT